MNDHYNLPPQTAQLLTLERIQKCKNLGLLLDKYAPQTAIEPNKSANKSTWLKELYANTHIDKQLAEQVYKRWQRTIETMKASTFTATTSWR